MQRTDLIMHQRNQRRHNDGDAVARVLPGNGWYLVAKRLAAAGWHQHQRIAAFQYMVDDGRLRAAKVGIAKDFAQDVLRRRIRG